MNVKNIEKKILNLIGRHFPKDHKYHKLFNHAHAYKYLKKKYTKGFFKSNGDT